MYMYVHCIVVHVYYVYVHVHMYMYAHVILAILKVSQGGAQQDSMRSGGWGQDHFLCV